MRTDLIFMGYGSDGMHFAAADQCHHERVVPTRHGLAHRVERHPWPSVNRPLRQERT